MLTGPHIHGGGTHQRVVETLDQAHDDINGGFDVNVQDQHTPPIDSYFLKEISPFTLSGDTGESTKTVLEYEVPLTPGHGVVAEDEILLLDVANNKSFYAEVLEINADVATVDRPIDNVFKAASNPAPIAALGRIVSSNMAVDGSAIPQVFSVRAGAIPTDVTRMIITMLDETSMDDGKFGGMDKLTKGFVFRVVDSFNKTIFNFKTNGDITNFMYDTRYADKAPGGQFGFSGRVTFAGQSKHGVVLRVKDEDVLQWIVQDNLTELLSLKVVAQGSDTTGEI